MFQGVVALARKELINLIKEPKSAFMIFIPIVIFLTLFVYASTKDVDNTAIAIFNQDSGVYSANIIDNIASTTVFKKVYMVRDEEEMKGLINKEDAFVGLVFHQNFSKNISVGKRGAVQIIQDGRRTNSAAIAYGYLSQIISKQQRGNQTISVRTWYNPSKDPIWFSITNLVCMIIINQAVSLASLSIAREKEEGTFDQLLVSPIKPLGLLIGKIAPCVSISLFMGVVVMMIGSVLYGVPIQGNIFFIIAALFVYVISVVGIGVLISSIANTQQQANLGTFIVTMPMISLSGILSPVESITNPIAKAFVYCNPIVYGNQLIKGLMLKDISIRSAMQNILPLLVIGCVVLVIAAFVFAKRHRLRIF